MVVIDRGESGDSARPRLVDRLPRALMAREVPEAPVSVQHQGADADRVLADTWTTDAGLVRMFVGNGVD